MLFKYTSGLFPRAFSSSAAQILHTTDNEGTHAFLKSIRNSTIVSYHVDNGLSFHEAAKNPYFIFGGDVTDRGPHDLSALEMLIDFKKRHPDRVTLLVGNREIKQCRFKSELDPQWIRQRVLYGQSPTWLSHKTFPSEYLPSDQSIDSLSVEELQLSYLKWMLAKTMGCVHTFRYRREELSRIQKRAVSEEEVLQSFMKEAAPDGLVGQYLQLGQVGVIIPNTSVLAVHGGLTAFNVGRIPSMDPAELPIQNIHEWIDKFNRWYRAQIEDWKIYKPTSLIAQPGNTALNNSIVPVPGKEKFAITANMLGHRRQFIQVAPEVSEYLQKNKISLVLTGHQPCGDYPAILRNQENNILFVNNDTSYANTNVNPNDTRGCAMHTTEIIATMSQVHVNIQAILSDAVVVKNYLTVQADNIVGDPYIGRVLPTMQLVQCKVGDDKYRLVGQEKYDVKYTLVNAKQIEEMALTASPVLAKPN